MGDGAILLAAGTGSRMQGATGDKILHPVNGKPLFQYSLESFVRSGLFSELVIVYREHGQRQALESIATPVMAAGTPPSVTWCEGGQERMHSVRNGLLSFQASPELIFIHDTARPMVQSSQLQELALAARTHGAACLGRPINDTIQRTDGRSPSMLTPVDRDRLWAMETPQVFNFSAITSAYDLAFRENIRLTDDTSAYALTGKPVQLIANPYPNLKATTPDDLDRLGQLLQQDGPCE